MYDQLLSFLRVALRTMFALGVVVAVGAWLAGPGKYATKIRASVLGLVRGHPDTREASAVNIFVGAHKNGLRVLVAGIGFLVLIVLSHPGPIAVLIVAVLVLLGLLLIEFLARNAPITATAETNTS